MTLIGGKLATITSNRQPTMQRVPTDADRSVAVTMARTEFTVRCWPDSSAVRKKRRLSFHVAAVARLVIVPGVRAEARVIARLVGRPPWIALRKRCPTKDVGQALHRARPDTVMRRPQAWRATTRRSLRPRRGLLFGQQVCGRYTRFGSVGCVHGEAKQSARGSKAPRLKPMVAVPRTADVRAASCTHLPFGQGAESQASAAIDGVAVPRGREARSSSTTPFGLRYSGF